MTTSAASDRLDKPPPRSSPGCILTTSHCVAGTGRASSDQRRADLQAQRGAGLVHRPTSQLNTEFQK